jgi:hypothetical protein
MWIHGRYPRGRAALRFAGVAAVCLGLVGCITQRVPMPDVPSVSAYSLPADAPRVGIAPTHDKRSAKGAGLVGAVKVEVGPELVAYVHGFLRRALAERGFRVVAAPDPREHEGGQGFDIERST